TVGLLAERSLLAVAQRQSAAGMVQEAGGLFGGVHHLELGNVEGIDRRQIDRALGFDTLQHALELGAIAAGSKQSLTETSGGSAVVALGQQVDEELGLRPVVRRVLIDIEEAEQAIDQVVDGGDEVGLAGVGLAAR